VHALFTAAGWFDWSLPEVFAGFDRRETPFPIAYPTAARPQAWAAGAPVLCLQLLLGLRPEPGAGTLRSDSPGDFPDWFGTIELRDVPAFGTTWSVRVEPGGSVEVA